MQYGNIKKKKIYYIIAYCKPNEKNEERVKIFDNIFIRKNKNKCKIIYKSKIYELKEYFEDIDKDYNHKDLIKFKLTFIHNIIDISYIFNNCDSLISLTANHEININSSFSKINFINMSCSFKGCKSLLSLPDLSNWNISNVEKMDDIFCECNSLISLSDISNWETSKVKNMSNTFKGCESLTSLPDISNWNTINVNDMGGMFLRCNSLLSLPNISNWKISNVKNMNNMFLECKSLKLPNFYLLNKDKNNIIFELTFKNNSNPKMKILGKEFIEVNKDKGTLIYNNSEFELKEYYKDIDNNNKNSRIKFLLCLDKSIDDLSHMFDDCSTLLSVKRIYGLDYNYINNNLKKNSEIFNLKKHDSTDKNCYINSNNNSSDSNSFYHVHDQKDILYKIDINIFQGNKNNLIDSLHQFSGLTNISYMFNGCYLLTSLPDISNWDTSNIGNMNGIFFGCRRLISLPDISKWNTTNVHSMSEIFRECNSLITLPDISKWDISNLINASNMFYGCNSLLTLPDISKWNTININDMYGMFFVCYSLISLPDISKWNTINVNDMQLMFAGCFSLTIIPDISIWDTSNVRNMHGMFRECNSLISLPDISKWKTFKVKFRNNFFKGCNSLVSLPDVTKWDTTYNIASNSISDECLNSLNYFEKKGYLK